MSKKLSVIIPAYNEEKMIPKTDRVISGILDEAGIDYELIFVNDGSRDRTWPAIYEVCQHNSRARGICFSRNFGKEGAMFAGLEYAVGDCAVLIDCDLQHPPEKIVEMYHLWEQGYEVIEGVKTSRGDESRLHTFCANAFYGILSKTTGMDMANASDFKLIDRKVIDILNQMPERNVFFRALSSWVGFKSTTVTFDVREREEGESKWSPWALVKYAFTNIVSFSSAPLQIVTVLGCICFAIAVIFGTISLVRYFTGTALGGFTTVILLELFIGSIVMTSLGVIGYYLAKMYEEVKGRPRYIVSTQIGGEDMAAKSSKTGIHTDVSDEN